MAIYKINDILQSLKSMKNDGFEYVDISEILPDESDTDADSDATLFIEAIENISSTETDIIDSVKLPDDYTCHS